MLNKLQIKLVQTAVRAAGIRSPKEDGRYRLLLRQYRQSNGSPCTSCVQLNNLQLDDLLAICESQGWRMPGAESDFYRKKISASARLASFAQRHAIEFLVGDLGWNIYQLNGFIERMTRSACSSIAALTPRQAWIIIEGLKAILERNTGSTYKNLTDCQKDMEVINAEAIPF